MITHDRFCRQILCLGFSNTSHVDSLDKFRKSAAENIKLDIDHLMGEGGGYKEHKKL